MRLIEKECPNCGAGLSFTKDDTSCKCEYCKREFEIERDTDKKKLADQFTLSELKTPFKIFSYITFGSFFAQAIIFLVAFLIIIIVGFNLIKGLNDSDSIFNRNANLVTNTSELSSSDYSTLDLNSRIVIAKETTGIAHEYTSKGSFKRERLYIISNDKTNYLIPVYKINYVHFTNSDMKHTVYVPVEYRNVKSKNNSISFSLDSGKVIEKVYNFDESNYTYGFSDLDTLYNEVIKQYEKGYKIVQK
jgi:hypothetical protein